MAKQYVCDRCNSAVHLSRLDQDMSTVTIRKGAADSKAAGGAVVYELCCVCAAEVQRCLEPLALEAKKEK